MSEEILKEINESLKKIVSYYEEEREAKKRNEKLFKDILIGQMNSLAADKIIADKLSGSVVDVDQLSSKHWREMEDAHDRQFSSVFAKLKAVFDKVNSK